MLRIAVGLAGILASAALLRGAIRRLTRGALLLIASAAVFSAGGIIALSGLWATVRARRSRRRGRVGTDREG